MTISQEQGAFALDVADLIKFIQSKDFYCTFGEAYRTPEQAKIYAQQGKGISDSLHCQRLAIDLNLFSGYGEYLVDYKDYEQFGIYWESIHSQNRWGGFFKTKYGGKIMDPNHFERKPQNDNGQ